MKLIGVARLGKDVELQYTQDGKAVAKLSLVYNYGKKGSDGKQPSQWVESSLWGKQAESLAPYLLKGAVFNFALRDVHIKTYKGKNGTGTNLAGTIIDIEFVPKQSGEKPAQASPKESKPIPAPAGNSFDDFEDDIPFLSCNFLDDAIFKKLRWPCKE